MVADRAGTSGSCQALRMMMRVAGPIGRRIGEGGGQMHHSGFEQADFRSFGLFLPVNWPHKSSRLGIRPALPTVQTQGAHSQRNRQTTPLHSTSNAGSVPERWLARVLLVRAVRCVGLARQFIVIWFDHTQPSPLLPMASTGHPSMASLQSASSSGVVGCLNT